MSGDVSRAEFDHPALEPLLAAWQCPDAARRAELLRGLEVPGPVALRSRYRHLNDPQAPSGPWDPSLDPAAWRRIIALETEGDGLVRVNDTAAVRRVFGELLTLEPSATHRVVTVHAWIGFGDAALAEDDAVEAARQYEAALALATEDHYRFGRLRALTGLGYITLRFHSAATSLDFFNEAAAIADELGDILYAANGALGIAECEERVGTLDRAAQYAERAHDDFVRLGSPLGVGNAAQRLAAILHRARRVEEAQRWYETAYLAFQDAGNPMGLSNVLGGLGDILLDDARDFEGAHQRYSQSLEIAEAAGLRSSRAHALQDLARVARSREDWPNAVTAFQTAHAAYRELDDILGMTHALDKMAEAYENLGDTANALHARLEAVFSIEEFRATHSDDRSQREYRSRFGSVYAQALTTAVRGGEAAAFAVVADCLAGRRLAGLFAETAQPTGRGELSLLQEMLVRSDQRLLENRRSRDAGRAPSSDPAERRERLFRLIGATSIKHGLADQAATSLDDLLATVYLPPADQGDALLATLPEGCHSLQIVLDPLDPSLVHWLWRQPSGPTAVGSTAMPQEAATVVNLLQADGDERAGLRIADLAPLSGLIPESLREELVRHPGSRLVIIPVGELWLVPWGAIPVRGTDVVLGEVAVYTLCPSLVIQRQLCGRSVPGRSREIELWRSPLVHSHDFGRVRAEQGWNVVELLSSGEAKNRMRTAGADAATFTVVGHGRLAPGLGHYLELDSGEWLLPADLIGAAAPGRLNLIACWGGAVPGRGPSDPLSIATLALAAGSAEVLATVGELADSDAAAYFVEEVLLGQADTPLAEALHIATRRMLEEDGMRTDRIHEWAPLIPIGTLYPAGTAAS